MFDFLKDYFTPAYDPNGGNANGLRHSFDNMLNWGDGNVQGYQPSLPSGYNGLLNWANGGVSSADANSIIPKDYLNKDSFDFKGLLDLPEHDASKAEKAPTLGLGLLGLDMLNSAQNQQAKPKAPPEFWGGTSAYKPAPRDFVGMSDPIEANLTFVKRAQDIMANAGRNSTFDPGVLYAGKRNGVYRV